MTSPNDNARENENDNANNQSTNQSNDNAFTVGRNNNQNYEGWLRAIAQFPGDGRTIVRERRNVVPIIDISYVELINSTNNFLQNTDN